MAYCAGRKRKNRSTTGKYLEHSCSAIFELFCVISVVLLGRLSVADSLALALDGMAPL